jgi:hypothetical protein
MFFGPTAVVSPDLVRLLFEGTSGTQTFTDQGSGGSVWTTTGTVANVQINTSGPKQGLSNLQINTTTDFITTSLGLNNTPTNASDWFIGAWILNGGTGAALMGASEGTGVPASRSWLYFINGTTPTFFYSDGTTTLNIPGSAGLGSGAYHYWLIQYTSGKLYFSFDGVQKNAGGTAFASSLFIPVSGTCQLRVNATQSNTGLSGRWDMIQIAQRTFPGGTGNFTPQTTPY